MELKTKRNIIKIAVIIALSILVLDFAYKTVANIDYANREKCILNQALPGWAFLLFEYLIELFLIILVGIFIALFLERKFTKYGRFYPKNPLTAFLYASLLPLCACSAIPLTRTMKGKISFATIITFVVAAPLLNPYVIILSFSVLGLWYGALRILLSFIIAISAGYVTQLFYKGEMNTKELMTCSKNCPKKETDLYLETARIFKSLIPYIVLAAAFGIAFEFVDVVDLAAGFELADPIVGLIIMTLIAVPIYMCNGADVLILRPFIHGVNLPLGSALAFSMTSTAVCISSIALLVKFIGKKLTAILITHIVILTLVMGYLINILHPGFT